MAGAVPHKTSLPSLSTKPAAGKVSNGPAGLTGRGRDVREKKKRVVSRKEATTKKKEHIQ